jgi:hypothetical protein
VRAGGAARLGTRRGRGTGDEIGSPPRAHARGCVRARAGISGVLTPLSGCSASNPAGGHWLSSSPFRALSRPFLGGFAGVSGGTLDPVEIRAGPSKSLKSQGSSNQTLHLPTRPAFLVAAAVLAFPLSPCMVGDFWVPGTRCELWDPSPPVGERPGPGSWPGSRSGGDPALARGCVGRGDPRGPAGRCG